MASYFNTPFTLHYQLPYNHSEVIATLKVYFKSYIAKIIPSYFSHIALHKMKLFRALIHAPVKKRRMFITMVVTFLLVAIIDHYYKTPWTLILIAFGGFVIRSLDVKEWLNKE